VALWEDTNFLGNLAAWPSEKFVFYHTTTRCYNPQYHDMNQNHAVNKEFKKWLNEEDWQKFNEYENWKAKKMRKT
jgi:hypothetical protein